MELIYMKYFIYYFIFVPSFIKSVYNPTCI